MDMTLTDGGIETRIIYEFRRPIGDFEAYKLLGDEAAAVFFDVFTIATLRWQFDIVYPSSLGRLRGAPVGNGHRMSRG